MKPTLKEAVLKEVGADNDPSVWRMPGGSGGTEQVLDEEESDEEFEETPLVQKIDVAKLNAVVCKALSLFNFDFEFTPDGNDEFTSNDFAWHEQIGIASELLNNLFIKIEVEEKQGVILLTGEIIGHNGDEALTKTLFREVKYE